MPNSTIEEATPPNNTVAINPLTFSEADLAKALQTHSSLEEPKEKPPEEAPAEPAAPEAPETPPGEAVEEPPAEVEPAAEATEQVDEETDPSGVQKRINKLTAQKKEAQEKAESLERELVELKTKVEGLEAAPPVVANAANPFAHIFEESKLREEWDKARLLKRWTEDNVDGCEFNGKEYSAEEIKQIRWKVEDALEVGIPQRLEYLRQYRAWKPEAEKAYPFWKDRNSPEYGAAQAVLKELPAITSHPDYQILIGDFLVGRAIRLAALAKQSRPGAAAKPLPPKAPKQPIVTAPAARTDGEQAKLEGRKKKFLSTGSVEELAQVLKGQL